MAEVTDKRDVLDHLQKSFTYVLREIAELSDSQIHETVQFFGQERTVQESLFLIVVDMDEHLGQAIAYARMNKVIPPWSRR